MYLAPIYDFLLVFKSSICSNCFTFWDVKACNISDLELDLSIYVDVKSDSATAVPFVWIWLPINVFNNINSAHFCNISLQNFESDISRLLEVKSNVAVHNFLLVFKVGSNSAAEFPMYHLPLLFRGKHMDQLGSMSLEEMSFQNWVTLVFNSNHMFISHRLAIIAGWIFSSASMILAEIMVRCGLALSYGVRLSILPSICQVNYLWNYCSDFTCGLL